MRLWIFSIIAFLPVLLQGQEVLNEYVRYGIENNLSLQQKLSGYQKSIEVLKEARGLFYPNISFNARFTVSEGGRVIDFPIGDLLNQVYSTLNNLTASNMFPMVENQQIQFLRPTEHETKLRLIQPVLNNDIYYNSKIKKELTIFENEDVNQYKRELIAEIKKAYYNVATADGVLSMLSDTRKLLAENVRVNKRLIENDKITMDYLYRSETELSKFDQELQNAGKNKKIACAYFNFLLNRSLIDSIIIQQPGTYPALSDFTAGYSQSAIDNREELKKLSNYSNISDMQVKMNKSGKLPDMFIAVDYGFQGAEYLFNKNQDYVQASAILSWNLFSGFQNRSKIRQSLLNKEIIDRKLEEAKKQIELQVINTMNELLTAEKGIIAAEVRIKNAREGFRLVNRKYEEGQASLIEFIDARTTLTQAEENLIISKFAYLSCFAEFEKVTAINKTE
ncbi:MAG: TolC family protein [Bacteroidales bacterium]|nr:TolC family protein [Bacteroidales bacterium]MDP3002428.1 TolC family protein [Bacteroidales bacterium]